MFLVDIERALGVCPKARRNRIINFSSSPPFGKRHIRQYHYYINSARTHTHTYGTHKHITVIDFILIKKELFTYVYRSVYSNACSGIFRDTDSMLLVVVMAEWNLFTSASDSWRPIYASTMLSVNEEDLFENECYVFL